MKLLSKDLHSNISYLRIFNPARMNMILSDIDSIGALLDSVSFMIAFKERYSIRNSAVRNKNQQMTVCFEFWFIETYSCDTENRSNYYTGEFLMMNLS